MSSDFHSRRAPCTLADLGMVSALGNTAAEAWPRLVAGDQSRFTERDDLIPGLTRPFGQVRGELPEIPPSLSRYACRNNQIALAAFEAIHNSVQEAIGSHGASRVGIVAGSSTAGLAEAEHAVREHTRCGALPSAFDRIQLEHGGLAEFLREVSGARGPCYALSTACSTGAKALVSARGLLDLGVCDAVIAGAADSLCRLTASGFHSLQAVCEGITNPMSRNRDGLTLGEGAAFFLVTRDSGGIQLLGAGESSDAHHMSAPQPEGRGAESSMRAALLDARLPAEDIAYLNLHGTGTPHNDSMESAAIQRVFDTPTPSSSTKPLMGHTLGASGALEAAVCWLVLTHGDSQGLCLPPHRYDGQPDPALPPLTLVGEGERCSPGSRPALMTNSFGFGGSNCTLVVGREAA
jgi:3-oxoacyl-[acyl-carrier-protein] synthase-1